MKLSNWKARRAGGRITVHGKDERGADAKIVGVDVIEPRTTGTFSRRTRIVAIDKDGTEHELAA